MMDAEALVFVVDDDAPRRASTDAILAIRKDYPDARIIMLTTYSGGAQAVRALKSRRTLQPARARCPGCKIQ